MTSNSVSDMLDWYEPTPEPVGETPTATVNAESNARAGPGTDCPAVFWLVPDTVVSVMGRNRDGSWLYSEHGDRTIWILRPLTDIAPLLRAGLPRIAPVRENAASRGLSEGQSSIPDNGGNVGVPAEQPAPIPTPPPVVVSKSESTLPMVEPEPGPTPLVSTTVTGTVVNLPWDPTPTTGLTDRRGMVIDSG